MYYWAILWEKDSVESVAFGGGFVPEMIKGRFYYFFGEENHLAPNGNCQRMQDLLENLLLHGTWSVSRVWIMTDSLNRSLSPATGSPANYESHDQRIYF